MAEEEQQRERPAQASPPRRTRILGWIALIISTVIATLWAFWGGNEAFHEGWWKPTLAGRLLQTLLYLSPMLITLALCLLAVRWPRLGAIVYFGVGLWFSWFILAPRWDQIDLGTIISWLPSTALLAGVGFLWWFGKPWPRRWAVIVALALPLLVTVACIIEPIIRISQRSTEVVLSAVTLPAGNSELTWAPAGPGWVRSVEQASDWYEAMEICARLSEDGLTLEDEPQNLWRLPTVAEAAASFTRHGENAGGSWDAEAAKTSFRIKPDKEPPLWDPLAETVYWWTATQTDETHAYFIVYHGGVFKASKDRNPGHQGFRAVKATTP